MQEFSNHPTHHIILVGFAYVRKKNALRMVQSLELLNKVTIRHSGVPQFTEQLTEHFAGCARGSMMDLSISYDEHTLAPSC